MGAIKVTEGGKMWCRMQDLNLQHRPASQLLESLSWMGRQSSQSPQDIMWNDYLYSLFLCFMSQSTFFSHVRMSSCFPWFNQLSTWTLLRIWSSKVQLIAKDVDIEVAISVENTVTSVYYQFEITDWHINCQNGENYFLPLGHRTYEQKNR